MAKSLPGAKKLSVLLSLVWRNPSYSLDRILAELPEVEGKKIFSRSGTYKVLTKLGLNTVKKRRAWARGITSVETAKTFAEIAAERIRRKLTPEERLEMIRLVEREETPVARVAQVYGVSRKNFYKWKKRYEASILGKEYQAVCDQKPVIERRWNQLTNKQAEAILKIVREHPEYSTHKVAQILAEVGNHGVQNVFQRLNLNTYEKRLAYAQAYQPVTIPVPGILERLKPLIGRIPIISAIPPPKAEVFRRAGPPFVFSFLSSVTLSTIFIYWLRMVSQAPTPGAKIGLFFATIALSVGSIFFAYSMKYYLTLAIVLSFSRQAGEGGIGVGLTGEVKRNGPPAGGWLARIFGIGNGNSPSTGSGLNGRNGVVPAGGLQPSLDHIKLKRYPFVSIHLPFYNEKKVAERILKACTAMDYPGFEIIVIDDSTDETTTIVQRFAEEWNGTNRTDKTNRRVRPVIKILHRSTRQGFKGGALREALRASSPKAEFIVVFDADFIPYLDTLELFVKYFKANNNNSENYSKSKIACVAGYQWHVLNKSENWITRGVRTEYAGSYVIERPGQEILGAMKLIHGSVYCIRADILKKFGWGTSLTEDFELTLKLYEQGYKVIYTPYIQAPAECVSTLKRLIRQRMRWAEGHSHCIKKMLSRLLTSPKLTLSEKLEVLYLSPYYLQAFFFLVGTLSWLMAETVFRARLPFWTSLWGWSLVLTNFLSLPLVNAVGLFLEESEEKDYLGILSFVALSYLLVPFQAYASVKGFLEKEEGPWFRTPKTGKITDIFTRGRFYRWISGIIPGRRPEPALARSFHRPRSPFGYLGGGTLPNPYLALATANNRFENFRISRKSIRGISVSLLAILLIISLTLVYLAPGIPNFNPGGVAGSFVTGQKGKFLRQAVNLGISQVEAQEYGPPDEAGFRERIDLRNRTSKTKQKFVDGQPTDSYTWDGQVGAPAHYKDAGGAWQDINTELKPSTRGIVGFGNPTFEMTENEYEMFILGELNSGVPLVRYVSKNTDYWVQFAAHNLQWTNDLDQISLMATPPTTATQISGSEAKWPNAYGAGRDLRYTAGAGRMQKWLDIASPLPAPAQFIIDGGNPVVEFAEIVEFHPDLEVWVNGQKWNKKDDVGTTAEIELRSPDGQVQFVFPVAVGYHEGTEDTSAVGKLHLKKAGAKLYVTARFPLSWLQTATYPIHLDTTVDEQIAATGDDYSWDQACTWFANNYLIIGTPAGVYHSGFRFQTVAVPQGATINVSYVQLYGGSDSAAGAGLMKIYGNDVDNATAPTTCTAANGLVLTTAAVDWDYAYLYSNTWHTSPSINSVIQEIVDRAGWVSNNNMQLPVKDDGSFGYGTVNDYSTSAANSAKLHIEYTSNSAPNTPTLDSPVDTATNVSTTPDLKTTATDPDTDNLKYKIQLDTVSTFDSGNLQTFDQTVSQTGWSGQNTDSGTAYTSGTQATYTVQSALSENTTYYWRSYAIDYAGSNTWSGTQSPPYSFTTVPEWSIAFILLAAFLPKRLRRKNEREKDI